MKIGRRLSIKLLNVSKFVLGRLDGVTTQRAEDVTEPLDRDVLAMLRGLIGDCTTAFLNYDYARALEKTESFFWSFCDNYVELVKIRAYGGDNEAATRSARATLSFVALGDSSDSSRPFFPSSPRRYGVGGTRTRYTWRRGPRLRNSTPSRVPQNRVSSFRAWATCSKRFGARRARPRSPNAPRSATWSPSGPRNGRTHSALVKATCVTRARCTRLNTARTPTSRSQ